MEVRTRFAPSPTGYMHIGNLRSGLYAYLFARHNHGKFLLRIEDTDQERFVEGATDLIYRTLRDVGMNWDEGPDIGGEYGPYVQSERKSMYLPFAEQLIKGVKRIVILRSRSEGSVRLAMTPGTVQPNPTSIGTMLRPESPIFRRSLSITKATLAI